MKDQCHPSHVTRVSFDSSSYDEICINCNETDMVIGGWGQLRFPCKNPQPPLILDLPIINDDHINKVLSTPFEEKWEAYVDDSWKEYENDFNAMTDYEIRQETNKALRELEEAESWLDAVALWEKAGKPRKGD